MAINRELSQFGRLVEIRDGEHIGIGTTSNVSVGFGTVTVNRINGLVLPTSSGSAGNVLKTDGSGNLTFEPVGAGGTWAVTDVGIHTTKSVGVGTTNPTSKFTVLGDGKFSGVVTATSFSGDGSSLTNVSSASTIWRVTSSGIHTLSSVGIGTEARSAHALTVLGTGSTALFVDGNARITGILSIGTGTVTIDGDNSTIVATNFIGELTSNFPSGDYGDFSGGSGVDAFGQVIIDATLYDLLDTPSNNLRTEDLGVLI
jgi:hypothetical protein